MFKFWTIEGQLIRLCTQFYSEEIQPNYILLQQLSLQISIDKLKFQINTNKSILNDTTLLVT